MALPADLGQQPGRVGVDLGGRGQHVEDAAVYDHATSPVTLRTRAQVAAFFDGWDLVEPGLVQVPLWRPDGKPPRPRELERAWIYGGVARTST